MKKNENIYICKIKNFYKDKDSRIYYFDYLRIFCSFFVILIHVSAYDYYHSALNSYNWKISYYYNALSRFSVPNFFMISGALFLNRDLSYGVIFNKYIKNIFIHLILWSIIYSLNDKNFWTLNIKKKLFLIIKGHYHLWYLFATIGIYISIPFLREIAKNAKLLNYFISSHLIILFIIPNYIYLFSHYSKDIYNLLNYIISVSNLNKLSTNLFYFTFGHYLNKKKSEKNCIRIIIYIIGFISLIFTSIITYNFAFKKNKKINHFSFNYLNIFFLSISIFLFFKNNINNITFNKKHSKIIQNTAKLTYGIYLIHPLIIKTIVENTHFFRLSIEKIFLIPMLNIFIFLFSLIISIIIKKLPLISKYLI